MIDSPHPSQSKLYRNRARGKVAGVCAGIADYIGIGALPIRVIAVVVLLLFTVPTLILYFGAAWLLDEAPPRLYDSPAEEKFWQRIRATPSATTRDLRHKFWEAERRLRSLEAHLTSKEFDLRRKFRDLEANGT